MRLIQSARQTTRSSRRRGLTLIELIVVLMILIALAGLLAPMLPSMLTRAHTSTCSTNIASTAQAIQQYQQLYQSNPNNYDALGDGTTVINYFAGAGLNDGTGTAPGTWPIGQGAGMANGEIATIKLQVTGTQDEALNLTGVGITSLQAMVATPAGTPGPGGAFDPTFNNYVGTSVVDPAGIVTVADGITLAGLDPANNTADATRCAALNLSLTGRYVLLGIGPRCSMIGKTMQSAPVHFGDQPALNPEYGYERLVAIYQVSDTGTGVTPLTQARLVGTAPVHDTGIGSIQDELANWYQLTTGGS